MLLTAADLELLTGRRKAHARQCAPPGRPATRARQPHSVAL